MAEPTALFALMPEVFDEVFTAEALGRLKRVARLPDCEPHGDLGTARARAALADAEILVTGWGCPRLDTQTLDAAPKLRAVIHAAGSVKYHLDEEVFDRGIAVSSAAEANMRPVAEYTVAMCVLAAKRAFGLARAYAAGENMHDYVAGRSPSLRHAAVGIVGASRIGRMVIGMLGAYDVDIAVYDPYLSEQEAQALGVHRVELDRLCATSDIVSIHAPELPETINMIGEAQLSAMRQGTVLINTARGALVETAALARHCQAGRIDAVLDVTEPEPLPTDHPLLHLPNVVVTPHLAGAKGREVSRLGDFAIDEVERFIAGRELLGRVTAAELARTA